MTNLSYIAAPHTTATTVKLKVTAAEAMSLVAAR